MFEAATSRPRREGGRRFCGSLHFGVIESRLCSFTIRAETRRTCEEPPAAKTQRFG
jgi:hypothetical protein